MSDLISRQAAIDALRRAEALTRAFGYHNVIDTIRELPSAQPDADAIHLQKEQAYKQGWEDGKESIIRCKAPIQVNLPDNWIEQIVNRLRNDPEAEWAEIVRCKNCKHRNKDGECGQYDDGTVAVSCEVPDDHYCGYAERREE